MASDPSVEVPNLSLAELPLGARGREPPAPAPAARGPRPRRHVCPHASVAFPRLRGRRRARGGRRTAALQQAAVDAHFGNGRWRFDVLAFDLERRRHDRHVGTGRRYSPRRGQSRRRRPHPRGVSRSRAPSAACTSSRTASRRSPSCDTRPSTPTRRPRTWSCSTSTCPKRSGHEVLAAIKRDPAPARHPGGRPHLVGGRIRRGALAPRSAPTATSPSRSISTTTCASCTPSTRLWRAAAPRRRSRPAAMSVSVESLAEDFDPAERARARRARRAAVGSSARRSPPSGRRRSPRRRPEDFAPQRPADARHPVLRSTRPSSPPCSHRCARAISATLCTTYYQLNRRLIDVERERTLGRRVHLADLYESARFAIGVARGARPAVGRLRQAHHAPDDARRPGVQRRARGGAGSAPATSSSTWSPSAPPRCASQKSLADTIIETLPGLFFLIDTTSASCAGTRSSRRVSGYSAGRDRRPPSARLLRPRGARRTSPTRCARRSSPAPPTPRPS